ncbi:disulfide bond formation protein B [Actinospongicola halichondriae]|uniref:disulfide bond formation protein B n=1 Tax=Actinospongicola halichondriae TaxID=3236844 RepID=UPI003D56EB32
MDPDTPARVADVLGTLAIAGSIATVLLVVGLLVPSAQARIVATIGGSGTALAAGIAAVAMGGSLWFSESAGFPPCELCWYQRIAMYPLVVVLAVASWRGERSARLIAALLAGAGLIVNVWHNVIETNPELAGDSCDPDNPCTLRWVEGLGFWTIPRLAGVCFVLILLLTAIDHLADPGADS